MGAVPSQTDIKNFKKWDKELKIRLDLIKDKTTSIEDRLGAIKEAQNLINQILELSTLPLTQQNFFNNMKVELERERQVILYNELKKQTDLIEDKTNLIEVRIGASNEAQKLIILILELSTLSSSDRDLFNNMKVVLERDEKILRNELTEQQNAKIKNDDMELQTEIEIKKDKDIGMISLSKENKLTVLDKDNNQLYTVTLYKQVDFSEIEGEIRDNKLSTLDDFTNHTVRKIFNFTIPKNDPNFIPYVQQIEKKYKNNFKELSPDERGLQILDMVRSGYSNTIDENSKTIDKLSKDIDEYSKTIDEYSKTIDEYSKTIDSIDEINYYISLLRENYVSDTRISTCNMLFICLLHFILMVLILSVIVRLIMNKC